MAAPDLVLCLMAALLRLALRMLPVACFRLHAGISRNATLSGVCPANLRGTQPPLLLSKDTPTIAHIHIFGAAACRRLSCAGCRSAAGSWTRKQSSQGADPATGVMQPGGVVQLASSRRVVEAGRPCAAAATSQCAALCTFAPLVASQNVWAGSQVLSCAKVCWVAAAGLWSAGLRSWFAPAMSPASSSHRPCAQQPRVQTSGWTVMMAPGLQAAAAAVRSDAPGGAACPAGPEG